MHEIGTAKTEKQQSSLNSGFNSAEEHLRDANSQYERLCQTLNRLANPRPSEAGAANAPTPPASTIEGRLGILDTGIKTLARDLCELANAFERVV